MTALVLYLRAEVAKALHWIGLDVSSDAVLIEFAPNALHETVIVVNYRCSQYREQFRTNDATARYAAIHRLALGLLNAELQRGIYGSALCTNSSP